MAARSVRLRERSAIDVDEAADHHLGEAGADVALRYVDAVERAVSTISRSPHAGSLWFSHELAIPGLSVRPVPRHPYLVFSVVGDAVVDIWRILHTRRDIPSAIADPPAR